MTSWRPFALLHRLGWLALALMGCGAPTDEEAHNEGGQTGSAACGTSPRCICDSVVNADVVRGVVTFTTATEASIEVLEVLGSGELSVGATLVGPYQVGFPCGLGNLPQPSDGAEVLVANPTAAGVLPSNMYLVAWAPTLQLTPELTLSASDAWVLTDSAACGVRFPDKEIVCKDDF